MKILLAGGRLLDPDNGTDGVGDLLLEEGRIAALPWAGSFLGHDSIGLELLRDGSGMPDSISGAVESPDAELNRVIALVLEHARLRPDESLMVVTASRKSPEGSGIPAVGWLQKPFDIGELLSVVKKYVDN